MRRGAFEIQTVANLEAVVFGSTQPNFKFAAEHVEELLAVMRVRLAASTPRPDAEQVRFHHGVAPGEQFHAYARGGFQNLSVAGAHEPWILSRRLKKGKNIRAVKAGDAA